MEVDISNKDKLFMCDICEEGNFTDAQMRDHMKEHTSVPSCPFCDLADVTAEEVTLHVNSVHLGKHLSGSKNGQSQQGAYVKDASATTNNLGKNSGIFSQKQTSVSHTQQCSKGQLFSDNSHSRHSGEQEISTEMNKSKMGNTKQPISTVTIESHSCPICPYETDCADVLLVHINQVHFEDTPEKTTATRKVSIGDTAKSRVNKSYDTVAENVSKKSTKVFDVSNMGNSDVEMVTEEEKNPEGPCDINRTPAKEGKPSCPFCDSEFEQDISLKFHVNGSHQNELQGIEPLDLNEDESSCVCPMCEENFPQSEISLFEAHVHSHFTASATPADSLYQQEMKRREEQAAKFKAQRNVITQEGSPSVSSSGSSNKKQSSSDSSSKIISSKLGVSKNSPNGTVNNKSGASKNTPGGTSLYKKQALKNMESAVARGQMSISDFYTQKEELSLANSSGVDEGATCTKGVMPKLEQFLGKQSGRYLVKYWLASPTDHYAASYGDKGWGCGYRNLQMLLSYVMKIPVFQQPVFNSTLKIPSIPKLQQLIEAAWSQGFDPQGKEQLQKLVHTRKWIGATEICAVLSSLKVKCRLIDFHCPTGPGNTHPRLFEWVKSFYSSSSEFKPPLYLQHQGHSRTIIGIEENKDGSLKLLIFDPSTPKPQMTRFAIGDIDNNKMKGLRRTLHGLKARQYQIVAIQGLLTDAEQKRSKLLRSERIP